MQALVQILGLWFMFSLMWTAITWPLSGKFDPLILIRPFIKWIAGVPGIIFRRLARIPGESMRVLAIKLHQAKDFFWKRRPLVKWLALAPIGIPLGLVLGLAGFGCNVIADRTAPTKKKKK